MGWEKRAALPVALALILAPPSAPAGERGPRQDQEIVPPTHWAHEILHRLALEGRIRRYPAFAFRGGRLFTRREAAEVVHELVRDVQETPGGAALRVREDLQRLIDEFLPELTALGADVTLPPPGAAEAVAPPAPWIRSYGSANTTWRLVENAHNDVLASLVDFNLETSFARVNIVGSIDDRGVDSSRFQRPGDWDLSRGWFWSTTERYALVHGRPFDDLRMEGKLGDLRNTSFASGLVLGAADPDGFEVRAAHDAGWRVRALTGRTLEETAVHAARAEYDVPGPDLTFGLSAARIDVRDTGDDSEGGLVGGVDVLWESNFLDVEAELADREGRGHAMYLRPTFWYFPNLRFQGVWRDYEDYESRVNNAPIYRGLSGGDDEDERAHGVGVVWSPFESLTLRGQVERTQRQGGDRRLRDHLIEARLRPWEGGSLSASFEYEEARDAGAINRFGLLDFTQAWDSGLSLSFNYTRDDRDGDILSTYRSVVRQRLFDGALTVELAHTYRNESHDEEHILQPRAVWRISDSILLSARYTRSSERDSEDSLDILFGVQW